MAPKTRPIPRPTSRSAKHVQAADIDPSSQGSNLTRLVTHQQNRYAHPGLLDTPTARRSAVEVAAKRKKKDDLAAAETAQKEAALRSLAETEDRIEAAEQQADRDANHPPRQHVHTSEQPESTSVSPVVSDVECECLQFLTGRQHHLLEQDIDDEDFELDIGVIPRAASSGEDSTDKDAMDVDKPSKDTMVVKRAKKHKAKARRSDINALRLIPSIATVPSTPLPVASTKRPLDSIKGHVPYFLSPAILPITNPHLVLQDRESRRSRN